ncbi:CAAX prenyl protease 2 isoform X2 [Sus scrofa]|uniref:CAAX prenyl protease 2 n=1 Tax=Sus scrofa TaxID=9823 RepID=A0A8D1YL88_PIG|nr:CAAX prenyl protease 2 isoform X2 [Sus scrofa]
MAALGGDGLRLLSVSRPERPPESAALGGPGPGLCCWVSVFSCLSLACSYVGSLYVWKSELPRDHPAVIKRRFTSVLVVSSLSPLCVLLWRELTGIQPGTSLLTLMGFRLEGIFPAALLPLLLTMILFLGPLMQLSMDCSCDLADGLKVVLAPRSWARCLTDMRWLRNQVIAPLTEELVFRACMLPMLAPCTGLGPAVFTCPLFFGVAHFHHIFEQLRFRQSSVGSIFLSAAFQFSYTAVFGAYTAFLFIRTGHLIGPVLCHSFCNYMGFPAVCAALEHPQRRPLLAGYALGGPFALCLPQKVCQPHITQEETNLRWKRNRLGHLGVEAFLALSTSDRCHDATSLVPGGTQPKGSEHEQPCHATLELKVLSQTQGGCPASPSLRVVVGEKETDVQSLPAAPKHNWP